MRNRTRVALPALAIALVGVLTAPPAGAAARPFSEAFNGGKVGSRPDSGNTAYDQSTGDRGLSKNVKVVFDAHGRSGKGVRFYNTYLADTFGFLGKQVGDQKLIYLRRYYSLDKLPKSRMGFLLYKYNGSGNGQLGGTHNGSVAVGGSAQGYKFTLVNNNKTSTIAKTRVPTGSWFRIEAKLDFRSGHGKQTVRIFVGKHRNWKTPSETISGPLAGSHTDYLEDGLVTNPGRLVNLRMDQVRNGRSWVGPWQGK